MNERIEAALAEALGTDDLEIVADETDRLPDGEVRLVTAAVRGEPNQVAAVTLDPAGDVRPRHELEAAAGRPLFPPDLGLPAERIRVERTPVSIDPPTNTWTLPKCATERETVTVTVPPFGGPPKADVYLLADTTSSMTSVLAAVAAGSTAIVTDPSLAAYDVAWGVGNYRDFPVPVPNSYAFEHQISPSTNPADATLAIGTWTALQGGDGSEGQLYALEQIATDPAIGWRLDAKRILVWFGDAPGHDPICRAISGLATDVTEGTATAALAAAGITVVAVSTTTGFANGMDDDPTAFVANYAGACPAGGTPGQATRIAAGAAPGGSHTSGIDAGAILTTLSGLIAAAVSTIASVTLLQSGAIAEFVPSIIPATYGPLAGDVEHVLEFEVTWTGDRDCGERDQFFTGSLDVVADGVIVASKPVTVTVPACRWHHCVEVVCGEERSDKCQPVVDGRYATAVTIYNPTSCPIRIEKRFAALVREGRAIGREPDTQPARPFARIVLEPGEATMDDCCSLREVAGPAGALTLGVLDIIADGRLEVSAIHTAGGADRSGPSISTRAVQPRRA